jgi:hypothetical protein
LVPALVLARWHLAHLAPALDLQPLLLAPWDLAPALDLQPLAAELDLAHLAPAPDLRQLLAHWGLA